MTLRTEYKPGEFSFVDLAAADMQKAKLFYQELFGWAYTDEDTAGGPPYAMFRNGEGKVIAGLGQLSDEMKAAGVPPVWNSYVSVADATATAERATTLGAKLLFPVMKITDAGHMTFIQDPQGPTFAIWQAENHIGSEVVAEPNAFCWNELATPDMAASKRFYGELFGWSFEDGPQVSMIKTGDKMNGHVIQMTEEWAGVPPHWGVYFAVADADGTCDRISSLGGKVIRPAVDIPAGRFAVVSDEQGAFFTVIQLAPLS